MSSQAADSEIHRLTDSEGWAQDNKVIPNFIKTNITSQKSNSCIHQTHIALTQLSIFMIMLETKLTLHGIIASVCHFKACQRAVYALGKSVFINHHYHVAFSVLYLVPSICLIPCFIMEVVEVESVHNNVAVCTLT